MAATGASMGVMRNVAYAARKVRTYGCDQT